MAAFRYSLPVQKIYSTRNVYCMRMSTEYRNAANIGINDVFCHRVSPSRFINEHVAFIMGTLTRSRKAWFPAIFVQVFRDSQSRKLYAVHTHLHTRARMCVTRDDYAFIPRTKKRIFVAWVKNSAAINHSSIRNLNWVNDPLWEQLALGDQQIEISYVMLIIA